MQAKIDLERPNISLNAKVTRSIFLTASSGKTGLVIFLGMSVFCVAQPCALLKSVISLKIQCRGIPNYDSYREKENASRGGHEFLVRKPRLLAFPCCLAPHGEGRAAIYSWLLLFVVRLKGKVKSKIQRGLEQMRYWSLQLDVLRRRTGPSTEVSVSSLQRSSWMPAVSVDHRDFFFQVLEREMRGKVLWRQTLSGSGNFQSWRASTAKRARNCQQVHLPRSSFSQDISSWQLFPCSCFTSMLHVWDWRGWALGMSWGASAGLSDATTAGLRGWKGSRYADFRAGTL